VPHLVILALTAFLATAYAAIEHATAHAPGNPSSTDHADDSTANNNNNNNNNGNDNNDPPQDPTRNAIDNNNDGDDRSSGPIRNTDNPNNNDDDINPANPIDDRNRGDNDNNNNNNNNLLHPADILALEARMQRTVRSHRSYDLVGTPEGTSRYRMDTLRRRPVQLNPTPPTITETEDSFAGSSGVPPVAIPNPARRLLTARYQGEDVTLLTPFTLGWTATCEQSAEYVIDKLYSVGNIFGKTGSHIKNSFTGTFGPGTLPQNFAMLAQTSLTCALFAFQGYCADQLTSAVEDMASALLIVGIRVYGMVGLPSLELLTFSPTLRHAWGGIAEHATIHCFRSAM
jgi:hypothetical protein